MKKIIQNISNGETSLVEVPVPKVKSQNILIKSSFSLISPGTEKILTEFGNSNWLTRAKKNPDKVMQVINKIKTDGLIPAIESVKNKLDFPIELGYCNVGKVVDIGSKVTNLSIGERVISNGSHAEYVSVPKNLTCKIPNNVTDEQATFTVLGAIGLNGIRLAKLSIGEKVVVFGLGIVGLMTTQILLNSGYEVLCIDIDQEKLNIAKLYGAETYNSKDGDFLIEVANNFSNGNGVDAVFIASSSSSNDIIHNAAQISRKRGKIILIGVTGLKLNRSDFYEKELIFQVSCSYGPGRYDYSYEDQGNDYPFGFVRWTEQRNFEFILSMISKNQLKVDDLISQKFKFEDSLDAYKNLGQSKGQLGIIFEYNRDKDSVNDKNFTIKEKSLVNNKGDLNLGIIGSGNFTSKTILPIIQKNKKVNMNTIVSNSGFSGSILSKKFKFLYNSTDVNQIFKNEEINFVVIATRHDTHAQFVIEALKNNKNIFIEKPLALNLEELEAISKEYSSSNSKILVDFNRRFSPQIKKTKSLLEKSNLPRAININVNSGYINKSHWTQDLSIGGGRIIGEVCHFIDLALFIANSNIKSWSAKKMKSESNDTLCILLEFDSGSICSINYFSNGSAKYQKETIEIFTGNKILKLNNFLKLKGYGWKNFRSMNLWKQDKGHKNALNEFIETCSNSLPSPINFVDIYNVTKISIEISNKLKNLANEE
ncbi:bi-domain-containing oxidoreductase [Pelagibacteraceae bacterium]|nr:bi-domain-containing oxidoreductase [Pelagibacteraceae bacterium]